MKRILKIFLRFWVYTRLSHIMDKSAAEVDALLSNEAVTITLYVEP